MISAYFWNINHENIRLEGMIETGIFTVAISVDEARRFIKTIIPECSELMEKEPDLITPYGTVGKTRSNITPKRI